MACSCGQVRSMPADIGILCTQSFGSHHEDPLFGLRRACAPLKALSICAQALQACAPAPIAKADIKTSRNTAEENCENRCARSVTCGDVHHFAYHFCSARLCEQWLLLQRAHTSASIAQIQGSGKRPKSRPSLQPSRVHFGLMRG